MLGSLVPKMTKDHPTLPEESSPTGSHGVHCEPQALSEELGVRGLPFCGKGTPGHRDLSGPEGRPTILLQGDLGSFSTETCG